MMPRQARMELSTSPRQASAASSPGSSSGSRPSSLSTSTTTCTKSKRMRVVVSQSKGGCLTCKARRVKCDEQRPLCQRCLKAGRLCDGYGQTQRRAASSSSASASPSTSLVRPALKSGVQADTSTERLSYLAAQVLSLDSEGLPLTSDGVWGRVFLQLSHQVECVKAAAAAFGAAYEARHGGDNNVQLSSAAWRHYGSALARLRAALSTGSDKLEAVALASMILACAEIMSQHEENALNHFLGAIQIVYKSTSLLPGGRAPSTEISCIKDELVKVDILIGGYGLAQTPQIARFEGYGINNEPEEYIFQEPHSATNAAMRCLYRSRHIIDAAARLRHKYPSWRDHDAAMCKAQSDLAVECQSILDGLASLAAKLQTEASWESSSARKDDREVLADIYGLRTQLTATLIFVLCIHDPFETLYDEYIELFQTIVSDAAASSRLRRLTKANALKRFSTRPGVIAPLFIVCMKCRDPSLRSLAGSMLREQGREGPSDGHIAAAIGARVTELESPDEFPTPKSAGDVPSENRIFGHGVFPERLTDDGRRVVDVEFSRARVPLAQGWGAVDYADLSNWVVWKEPIEI
ncbi:hypothetical protein NLU13_8927 [Sarocladium strictum]|uniref:Zn(2)-C6 fungal-type domain-containing protein n=1 Tax=Sarocladium strictum TaxID=5046 RepID=A0AA39L3F7_SARSR|nr:hypothetical protein NLU13_8927 [Sarocladium strictum]